MNDKIITIDGPSGVGKGSVARMVAQKLNWNLLDSGAIYRSLALSATNKHIKLDDEQSLADLALKLDLYFKIEANKELLSVYLDGKEVSNSLRTQDCGEKASYVAKLGKVRKAFLTRQRAFATDKGLVADGRDMGGVVFIDAKTKIFLTASAKERAKRRLLQLHNANNKGKISTALGSLELDKVEADIKLRDDRDMNRKNSPLKPALDATIVDTTNLTIDEVVLEVLTLYKK